MIHSITSTDNTVQLIRDFPDPDKKITLIQRDFQTKDHMTMAINDATKTDLFLLFDVDEFLPPNMVELVKDVFKSDPKLELIPIYLLQIFKSQWEVWKKKERFWHASPRALRQPPQGITISHIPVRYRDHNYKVVPHTHRLLRSESRHLHDDLYIRHFTWPYHAAMKEKIYYHIKRNGNSIKQARFLERNIDVLFSKRIKDGANISWQSPYKSKLFTGPYTVRPLGDERVPSELLRDIAYKNTI
jgi:hypothetical protein